MSTAVGVFIGIVVLLTITAFALKIGMLYAASIVAWLITTFLLWNQTWPTGNTYIQTAVTLFGALMIIIMTAATIMSYLSWSRGRRKSGPTDEEEQASYKKTVYGITKKKDRWS